MKEALKLVKSVGRYGVNRSADVTLVQQRLNKWIAAGKLPKVPTLVVDGQCGPKTKQAVGAFQLRYVGMNKPDSRIDVNGETLRVLGLDYSQGSAPVGDPVRYDDWVKTPTDTSDDAPYWTKRGMFWYGIGLKGSAGMGNGPVLDPNGSAGADVTLAAMYNLKNEDNRFQIATSTRRVMQFGGGYSGSFVLCFATGMYHPKDFDSIQSGGVDFNFAVGAKWLSLARWAVRIPKMGKMISAVQAAKYASGDVVSEVTTAVKGAIAGFGIKEEDTQPSFVAIDIPFAGGGLEASVYYGITSYKVLGTTLS